MSVLKFQSSTRRLIAICFLILATPLSSELERLTVAYGEFPPYTATSEDGVAEGFAIDVISQLANEAGFNVDFVHSLNPAQTMDMLEAGQVDMTTFLVNTPERAKRALATREIGQFELKALALKKRGFGSADDLTGLRIGVVKGSVGLKAAALLPFVEVIEYPETDALILPLLTGEVDAVISTQRVFMARLRAAGVGDAVEDLSPPLMALQYGLLVNKDRPDVVQAMDAAIETSLTPASLQLLRERWFGRPALFYEKPFFWIIAGILAVSVFGLAAMGSRLHLYRVEASRLLKSNSANSLLIQALDEINAAIVIFDKDMRAIHRNAGFAKTLPSMVPHVDAGQKMEELISLSYQNGTVRADMGEGELQAFVDDIISTTLNGTGNQRTVHTTTGLVYEARDFRLGDDHFASIRVDVTAQYRQQEIIRQQAELLKTSNEQLQTFSAIAAHDLRAPLRNIPTLLDFVDEDIEQANLELPSDVKIHFQEMRGQTRRMAQLVEDLLLYANAGTHDGRPQSINPVDHLKNVVALITPPDGFEVSIPKDMPNLNADPTAFEAVMRNLIGNAIKHHDKDEGIVRVFSTERAGFLDIHVCDDGAGIPEKHREAIFEPFKRLTSASGGSGLGLSYIKKTVENWGGTVSITSAPIRGSTFTVSVPTIQAQTLQS